MTPCPDSYRSAPFQVALMLIAAALVIFGSIYVASCTTQPHCPPTPPQDRAYKVQALPVGPAQCEATGSVL